MTSGGPRRTGCEIDGREDEEGLRLKRNDYGPVRGPFFISRANPATVDTVSKSGILMNGSEFRDSKHARTLRSIFAHPSSGRIRWTDIETLLSHLGAELSEGRGSRVRVSLNGVRAVFHRPHPRPTTDKGAVRSVRDLLLKAGICP